jgi:hypothetical protein
VNSRGSAAYLALAKEIIARNNHSASPPEPGNTLQQVDQQA